MELQEEIVHPRGEALKGFRHHDEETARQRKETRDEFEHYIEKFEQLTREIDRRFNEFKKSIEMFRSALIAGLGELHWLAGLTFEELVRRILTAEMKELGRIPPDAELRPAVVEGERIGLFLEEPLIVGEAIRYAQTVEELEKLLRKAEAVKKKYGKEPEKILVILTAPESVAGELERRARETRTELIIGKVAEG